MNKKQIAIHRKDMIIRLCRDAGEVGICGQDLAMAIGYSLKGDKGGGGQIHSTIARINMELLMSREDFRIRPVIRRGEKNCLKSYYRIEDVARRVNRFEQPRMIP